MIDAHGIFKLILTVVESASKSRSKKGKEIICWLEKTFLNESSCLIFHNQPTLKILTVL